MEGYRTLVEKAVLVEIVPYLLLGDGKVPLTLPITLHLRDEIERIEEMDRPIGGAE